jgi:hypothetical protein
MSIGKFARELILAQPELKNDDVLAKIKKNFPEAKTTYACVAWYKSDLRKKGLIAKRAARSVEMVEAEIKQVEGRLEALEAELVELLAIANAPAASEESSEQLEEALEEAKA